MKKLLFILLACLPLFGMAKDKKDNSDPKYLLPQYFAILFASNKKNELILFYRITRHRIRKAKRLFHSTSFFPEN